VVWGVCSGFGQARPVEELNIEAGEGSGPAASSRLKGLELVEVLDELATEVGFVSGDRRKRGGLQQKAFTADAGDSGVEVQQFVLEPADFGP
jgi:hypothetical protein